MNMQIHWVKSRTVDNVCENKHIKPALCMKIYLQYYLQSVFSNGMFLSGCSLLSVIDPL